MKGYIAQLAPSGLRQFLPEHAVPADFLRQLVREWSARPRAAVWAVLAEPDAEAIRTGQYGVTKGVVCKGDPAAPICGRRRSRPTPTWRDSNGPSVSAGRITGNEPEIG